MRKAEQQAMKDSQKAIAKARQVKDKNQPVKIKKVGDSNTWICSDGERVNQTQINAYRQKAYDQKRQVCDSLKCAGCGDLAVCFAHIIPQARCKQIGHTELIWALGNFFPSCYGCNSAIENPKGQKWKELANIEECLDFIEKNDFELYQKFQNNI
jgi:5-methylcytosine-specific restriction endonuclease McrA